MIILKQNVLLIVSYLAVLAFYSPISRFIYCALLRMKLNYSRSTSIVKQLNCQSHNSKYTTKCEFKPHKYHCTKSESVQNNFPAIVKIPAGKCIPVQTSDYYHLINLQQIN